MLYDNAMDSKMLPTPLRIEPHSTRANCLSLEWSNGIRHEIPYFELRFECPCASCVDEKTGKRILRREDISADVRIVAAHPVGRYALQFQWSDLHSTGIYAYERLYELGDRLKGKA
ncbi:MAG: hypothetical protein RJB38_713 [Pseudomonadota bacterium]|jgi:DUF971 family protein